MGESSVKIEPSSVVFPPTYISSNSKFTVQLFNKSSKNINYEWRHYGSDEEEKEALARFDLGDPEQRLQATADIKFQSEAFNFEPTSGSVWPEKHEQIIVNFEPQMSLPHSETAYLYIKETKERIPFVLNGNGLAPEAAFSISSINVGHINLDSILEYEVMLENIGQVGVDFAYEPRNTDNLIYEFTPKSGHIDIGSKIPIRIRFIANFVGSFSHTFTFKIKGCVKNHPTINLYGRVLGPTFATSTKTIAFGDVSYGFLYEKTFEFENKSDIPFDYTINLTHDGSFSRREFAISPQVGTLQKWSKQTIKIEFIPVSEQDYDLNLFIDIAKFAPKLVTIPISAKCICPPVSMENSKINLGNIFIGYDYQGSVKLKNDSPLPAKFEFIPATDSSQLQASIVVPRPNGVVPAEGTADLNFSITPNQLGPLYIKQFVRIFGSSSEPIPFIIKAVCTGPNVEFSKNRIDFGTVSVLKNHVQRFKITNNSLISATYTLEIKQDGTPFSIEPSTASIPPGQEINIDVIAYLDDTIKFAGKAIFTFANLNPISVELLANGQGNTIVPSMPISNIDLGYVFTEQNVVKKFTLTNKGRRVQEVRWLAQKPKVQGSDSIQVSFKITPEVYTIEPGCTANYQLIFHCPRPCQFTMGLQCHGTISKQRIELFNPQIKGTFIKPALWFSKQVVEFKHVHNSIQEEEITGKPTNQPIEPAQSLLPPIENTFEIKNTCKLPLSLNAEIPEPFTMSDTNFSLQPAESKIITVTFDPSIKTDYACEVINRKINFNIIGHPQKNVIALKGQIVFPNIVFTPSGKIDFGILLMNTEQCRDITLKNPTELPVDFVWELLPQPDGRDTSSIFDIYPIRGHIEPFTTDVVHVSFFSKSVDNTNASYSGTCICHVIGGPDYVFKLQGGAADIQYKMEPQTLEFGNRGYLENVCVTNNLTNLSDVPINFAVKIPKGLKFQTFVVSPMEGILSAGQSVQFTVIAVAGLPKKYSESYFIQIGHFDEVRIDVNVDCFIPQAVLTLQRTEDDPLKQIVEEIRLKKAMQKKPKTVRSLTSEQTMTSRSGLEEEEEDYEEEEANEDYAELERQQLVQKLSTRVNVYEISPLKKHRKKDEPVPLYEGFVASKFVIDMGHIVFGKKEVRKFNIKSITPFPISFEILDGNLEGTGFSIDPCSYKDIPSDIDLEVTVVFDTKMRTNDALGDVVYEIPVVFSEDYAYIIYLKANLSMPVLNFSAMHFDFGPTIVGQAYVMTLQLQNMNSVSTEYKFGDAQWINVLQRAQQSGPPVFTASPSSGILPPASFQNIEISFQPQSEKSYIMQFPIDIKHNTQTSFITLKGAGVQLKVTFDPPELILPPILPFSEPSSITVSMVNPTQYPIEVMAPQYDLQLLLESLQNKQPELPPTEVEESPPTDRSVPLVTSTGNSNISKFSICVIVHGAPGSGRTTTSNDISQHLGIPVISLKTLWAEINKNPEASQADYVQAFSDAIAPLSDGFVIDGLDGITKESEETDAFLLHCIKTKNVWDEVQSNPFTVYKHDHLTAVEQALAYVIAALDGHYVFMVALRADEETLLARQEVLAAIERRKKRAQAKAEKERLFNMTEEQYLALSEEEQKQVD